MERICFLNKVEISRIIFDIIRQELNIEDRVIENNPYNEIRSKCILLNTNGNNQLYLVSTIYDGSLHFTLDVYRRGKRIRRSNMFGNAGNVSYTFTRQTKEDFEKDCISEFWRAYNNLPRYYK